MNFPRFNKVPFLFIKPDQNCEPPGLFVTFVGGYLYKYLLRNNCCHKPTSLINLKRHFLSKHLFLDPVFPFRFHPYIECPIWQVYISYDSRLAKRTWNKKKSILARTPLSISKKYNINIAKLVSTEFIKTTLPPTDICFHFQPLNFFSNFMSIIFQALLLNFQ